MLFGNEKDDSFKGSIGAIYQSFGGEDLYPTLGEKAANLLYFITKNHSFSDGNKRIAAAVFLYFLDKNNALFKNEEKLIDDRSYNCGSYDYDCGIKSRRKRDGGKCCHELI